MLKFKITTLQPKEHVKDTEKEIGSFTGNANQVLDYLESIDLDLDKQKLYRVKEGKPEVYHVPAFDTLKIDEDKRSEAAKIFNEGYDFHVKIERLDREEKPATTELLTEAIDLICMFSNDADAAIRGQWKADTEGFQEQKEKAQAFLSKVKGKTFVILDPAKNPLYLKLKESKDFLEGVACDVDWMEQLSKEIETELENTNQAIKNYEKENGINE